MNILNAESVLALGVSQDSYDSISLNRKSTFINLFDSEGEFIISVNTLDMKSGADYLFLAEVLRAGELSNLVEVNSLCEYKGLKFRLSAVQTSSLQSPLKRNMARKEDFQKKPPVAQPAQQQYQQQQPIQQQQVF